MTEHEVNDNTFCQSINNKRRSPNCVGSPQLEAAKAKKANFARLAACAVFATTVRRTHARTVLSSLMHSLGHQGFIRMHVCPSQFNQFQSCPAFERRDREGHLRTLHAGFHYYYYEGVGC